MPRLSAGAQRAVGGEQCGQREIDRNAAIQYALNREDGMGTFFETITLVNSLDRAFADSGYIPKDQIRAMEVEAMPDTGAWTLIID